MDFYAVLGVSQSASIADINSAYKKLALKHHPDKTGGDGSSMEQFRKIQDAVETLRDPERRRKHDESLGVTMASATPKKRYRFPEDDWRRWWDDDPDPSYPRRRPWNFDDPWDRYMYTFRSSAHMNPNSEYARQERARHAEDAQRWEEECAGYDPEVEKARNERRKEAMRARMKRDKDMMEEDDDEGHESRVETADEEAWGYPSDVEAVLDSDEEGERDSVDQSTEFVSLDDVCDRDHGDFECNCADQRASPFGFGGSSFYQNEGYYPRSTDRETDDEEAIFYDCSSEVVDSVAGDREMDRSSETALRSEDIRPESAEDHGPMGPFVPYFRAKVNRSKGRYTADDSYSELNGVVMETYCDWLERLRVSFPDAQPLPMRNNPWDCAHLGPWVKESSCPKCPVCHLWNPIYVLTCSGCGVKACVRCKFRGGASHA